MPDNFNDYSHFSHPSPSGSSDAHSSNGDAASTASSGIGFTEWTRDFDLDALYTPDFIAEVTEEELMEYLANIPTEDILPPEPQTIPPYLLQSFQPTQNVLNPASSASMPAAVAQPSFLNVPRSPFGAGNTWSAEQSQRFFSSPHQAPSASRQLPLRPVVLPTSPRVPIPPNLPSSQASSSSAGSAGDTQRLSLPAPGDMNYSSCEVIM